MEIVKGLIVKSIAGHDKGGFFVVTDVQNGYATICDGKRRSIDKQKNKKLIHLSPTTETICQTTMETNREIRKALRKYNA